MDVNTSRATRETYGNPMSGYAYHRAWSDGKLERRAVHFRLESQATGCGSPSYRPSLQPCWDSGWIEVPPPPSGNGFACRGDLNGDRAVDGDDLGIMLAAWGQSPACNPDPTYACVGVGGGVAP